MAVFGTDDRYIVLNPTTYPYTAIARIVVTFANGESFFASGTYVDSSHVLTAGHVVYDAARGGWATSITVTPDQTGTSMPYGQSHMLSVHAPTGWTVDHNLDFNYGLITLDHFSANGSFGYRSSGDATLMTTPLHLAGYSNLLDGATLTGADGTAVAVTPTQIKGSTTLDTSSGTAGAPLWFNGDDGAYVAGIFSYADATGNYFTRMTQTMGTTINGWIAGDIAQGTAGTIHGTVLDDRLIGTAANDDIAGGAGRDTVIEPGKFAAATFRSSYDNLTRFITAAGGQDWLQSVERVRFDDGVLILDGGAHGAEAYRLYQAAFARQPDEAGLMVQANALNGGMRLLDLAAAFLTTPEFIAKYGASSSDAVFATAMYKNVLGRDPDAGGLAVQVDALAHGLSRAQLLVNFSESAENLNLTGAYTRNGLFTSLVDTSYG